MTKDIMKIGWQIKCGPLRDDEGEPVEYVASTLGAVTHLFLNSSDDSEQAQLQLLTTLGEAAQDYLARANDSPGRSQHTDMDGSDSFYIELTEIEITEDMLTPIEDWPE